MSIRDRITRRLSILLALILLVPTVVTVVVAARIIHLQLERELTQVVSGAAHGVIDEASALRAIDWNEDLQGPDPLGLVAQFDGPDLPDGFRFDIAPEYEWLVRWPSGEHLCRTDGFPEVGRAPRGLSGIEVFSTTLAGGVPAMGAGAVTYETEASDELPLHEIANQFGALAAVDWRQDARPGFEGYGRFSRPFEVLAVRSVVPERRRVSRIFLVALGSYLAAVVLSVALVRRLVAAELAPLESVSDELSEIEPRNLADPMPSDFTVPDEITPVVQQIARLRARLARAFERERRFSADAAHELLTPLAGLRATLEVSGLHSPGRGEADASLVAQCLAIVARMESAVAALLEIGTLSSHLEVLPGKPVDVRESLQDSRVFFSARARDRDLVIDLDVPANALALVDRQVFQRAIDNLVGNAVEYATPGTTVRCAAIDLPGRVGLEISNEVRDPHPDLAHRAVDAFWRQEPRTDTAVPHAGLGLSLTQACLEAVAGTLEIRVEDGRFAARVSLPRA